MGVFWPILPSPGLPGFLNPPNFIVFLSSPQFWVAQNHSEGHAEAKPDHSLAQVPVSEPSTLLLPFLGRTEWTLCRHLL